MATAVPTPPPLPPTTTQFTYQLGNSLYVPLTSLSNTATLPVTRGPKFVLPAHVLAALCRVRDAEWLTLTRYYLPIHLQTSFEGNNNHYIHYKNKWKPWCAWLDLQDDSVAMALPPSDYNTSNELFWKQQPQDYKKLMDYLATATVADNNDNDSGARPTVQELVQEVQHRLLLQQQQQQQQNDKKDRENDMITSIVIAGEGEPLLRFPSLLELIRQLRRQQDDKGNPRISLRLLTNGLVPDYYLSLNNNADNSNKNNNNQGEKFANTEDAVAAIVQQLQETGLDAVSVALQTHSAQQYQEWMKPAAPPMGTTHAHAHARVCDFIRACAKASLAVPPKQQQQQQQQRQHRHWDVEVTAVDRDGVDHWATQELAYSLVGVATTTTATEPPLAIRWRPYFL